jgi:hypothetical protein
VADLDGIDDDAQAEPLHVIWDAEIAADDV